MSTEPGQDNDGSGTAGAGEGDDRKPGAKSGPAKRTGKSGAKPGKTVSAAAAKSGRDETTVDIDTGATDPTGKGTDETRSDLAQIDDAPAKAAGAPEIAPVKDTAEPPKPPKPAPPAAGESTPAGSAGGAGPAGWAKPAEPSGSVSTGRTDKPGTAFNSSGGPSGNSTSGSSGSGGRGFAGTVLKDRPSASTSVAPAGASNKPVPGKPARKAQLQLARLEPWSVMKFSFVMSLVCFVVLLVAVIVLYVILSGLGVFDAISDTVNSLTKEQGETTGGVDAGSWFSFVRVFGYTVLVGALNVLLITALSTVGSVIYNLAADLVGGVEVTLKEAE
ncbi:DUF3566 domain-containing protein [Actinomadura sp. NPDC000600]|uniref:DUF3566 domain-containing protein n=1 Tax=Actinomadura sp. NPDC000600 TaxID=3154262 RepID=UPI00339B2FA6